MWYELHWSTFVIHLLNMGRFGRSFNDIGRKFDKIFRDSQKLLNLDASFKKTYRKKF